MSVLSLEEALANPSKTEESRKREFTKKLKH